MAAKIARAPTLSGKAAVNAANAAKGKALLVKQLSAVEDAMREERMRNAMNGVTSPRDEEEDDEFEYDAEMVVHDDDAVSDDDDDNEATNGRSTTVSSRSSSSAVGGGKLPRGFTQHRMRTTNSSVSVKGTGEEEDEEDEDADVLERSFGRSTMSGRALQSPPPPPREKIDQRLMVGSISDLDGKPFLELYFYRGADAHAPHEVCFLTLAYQSAARFVCVSKASMTRGASFGLYSAKEDTPAALIRESGRNKFSKTPIFYLSRSGDLLYTFRRVKPTLMKIYEGRSTSASECRYVVLMTPNAVVMRAYNSAVGSLGATVAKWTGGGGIASESGGGGLTPPPPPPPTISNGRPSFRLSTASFRGRMSSSSSSSSPSNSGVGGGGNNNPYAPTVESETFSFSNPAAVQVENRVFLSAGCDSLLVLAAFGLADFFLEFRGIDAPSFVQNAAAKAIQPLYVRELVGA